MTGSESFRAAWWLPGGHCQTIWPKLCGRNLKTQVRHERLTLPDEDFIDVVYAGKAGQPIVMILHGLEGSAKSHYAQGMIHTLSQQGWMVALMHFRGCSGVPNLHKRSYHSGETEDLRYFLSVLQERYPNVPISIIGYSLGGNVLLNFLAKYPDAGLTAAVAVSVPYELESCVIHMQQHFAWIYHARLLKCLHQSMRRKFSNFGNYQTMWDFDHNVTAPLHGFTGAKDYYQKCSSRQFLKQITIPTLLIHALDDPLIPQNVIPNVEELAKCVSLEVAASGGHVGFIAGNVPFRPVYWLEKRIPEFFKGFMPDYSI